MTKELLIFVPTYNEIENVQAILEQLRALKLNADILFVDDNSPDGTGQLLDELVLIHPNVRAEHRSGKMGIGSAHRYGITWAYEHGYRQLVTMDCDFTHSPEYIPQFIERGEDADIVVGSRYLQKNSLISWNIGRLTLTHLGHWATYFFLRIPYDATGAFRLYNLDKIPSYFLACVQSQGYSFFFESLFILNRNGYRIAEIPTYLPARTYGHSKMCLKDTFHSLSLLVHLFITKITNPERFIIIEPIQHNKLVKTILPDPQGWNEYWSRNDRKQTYLLYDIIATFYRKFIISPTLNRYIFKYFQPSSSILHAGCGSGQVDRDISPKLSIMALDISPAALNLYKKSNPQVKKLIHASIFDIPLEESSLDGIYNLGVMEHFSTSEINNILQEFHRVLKPQGKVILFWPPKFGLSVMFLKFVHFILNNLLNRNVTLHPVEITRITSKKQAMAILEEGGFKLQNYSLSIADLFTHAIIVGERLP